MQEEKERDEKAAADAALREAALAAEAQMSQGASARAAAVAASASARAAAVAAGAAPAAAVAARAATWESIEDSVLRLDFSPWADDARDSFRANFYSKAPIDFVSSDEDFERQGQGAKRSRSSCSSRDVHSRSSGETLVFCPRADGAADKEGEPKQASQAPKKKWKAGSFAKANAAAKANARGAKAAAKRNPKALDPEV